MVPHSKVIIEFFGLPGAGKTSIAKELYSSLNMQSMPVFLYEDIVREILANPITRIIDYIRYGALRYWIALKLYINQESVKAANKKRLYYTYQLYVAYRKFLKEDKYQGYLLVDQGIMQALGSLNYDAPQVESCHLPKILAVWKSLMPNVNVVLCLVDEESAAERIISRGQNRGRFDKISDEKLTGELQKHQRIHHEILNLFHSNGVLFDRCEISTDSPVVENVMKIRHFILKKYEQ